MSNEKEPTIGQKIGASLGVLVAGAIDGIILGLDTLDKSQEEFRKSDAYKEAEEKSREVVYEVAEAFKSFGEAFSERREQDPSKSTPETKEAVDFPDEYGEEPTPNEESPSADVSNSASDEETKKPKEPQE